MSSSGSSYGNIHRYEPARESTVAVIAIVLLTIIEVVLVALFTYGLILAWGTTQTGNIYLGLLLAFTFLDLAFILLLYRKEFLPDVMVVKKRRRKWEDLYVREEHAEGQEFADGALEHFKRAVYPYYKKN